MGCEKEKRNDGCVIPIVKDIVVAQNSVMREPSCKTGCAQSINDLLHQDDCHSHGPIKADTIPVILYCKSTCKPFVGLGASDRTKGCLEESFIFRINEVNRNDCAVVELLKSSCREEQQPSKYTDKANKLKPTGICLTVDLHCFCHISCLPAIKLGR